MQSGSEICLMETTMTKNCEQLLKLIKLIRCRKKLTLAQVAESVDIDTGNLCRIEHARNSTSLDTYCRIMDSLGYTVTIIPKEDNNNDTEKS